MPNARPVKSALPARRSPASPGAWRSRSLLTLGVGGLLGLLVLGDPAQARKPTAPKLGDLATDLREAEENVVAAERAAAKDVTPSEAQLAKRLVDAQLRLAEGDAEGAAIRFLDLLDNHPQSQAGAQAVYYLGEALVRLNMSRWATELFAKNLADKRPDAVRYHQRSVARLFDLAVPRREPGFARRPGIWATPEVRARLQSVGVDVELSPPAGTLDQNSTEQLVKWAHSFGPAGRGAELRFAFGRWLFLTGKYDEAVAELDAISPVDVPIAIGGPEAKWRLRAAYIAAAATLAQGDQEGALERFALLVKARPSDPNDRQIVELGWMALGRIHHDRDATGDAVRAYRRIGRDSPFFAESLYETAWTLLRGGRFDQAVQALDLLLIYDPESAIVPEIKQLRGKIRIAQRNYKSAEEEFLGLRREFDQLAQQLGRKLQARGDATAYFAAVVAEDMEHFDLAAILPVDALPVARSLPRAVQAQGLAQDVGALERELAQVRALLARMEEAVNARDKARLFNDLAVHAASLDSVEEELLSVQEALIARVAGERDVGGLEATRRQLRDKVDRPLGGKTDVQAGAVAGYQRLAERAHKLDLVIAAMRAELVASERYYEETRKAQKIDHQGFLREAGALRDLIAVHEDEVAAVREEISAAQGALRYDDPVRAARVPAVAAYRKFLQSMYAAVSRAAPDPDADTLWRRGQALADRADKARSALDRTAGKRLEEAVQILSQERVNLDGYLVELTAGKADTRKLVGEVLTAAYRDVVTELANLVLRSEVGLLDVAWAMKEAESDEVERLERELERELKEIDRAIDLGLEDVQ